MALTGAADTDVERVLFIHVMKTGGTTLFWHLRNQFSVDQLYPQPGLDFDPANPNRFRHLTLGYLEALPEERRRQIRVYAAHFPYLALEALGGDLVTMTILRDPVDRSVSLLRQWCRNRPQLSLTLEQAYELPQVYRRLIHNHQTKVFSMVASDEPRAYVAQVDVDESRLALAKENLARVDVLGLTERYDDFLDLVAARFGWDVKRELRANVAPEDAVGPESEALRQRIAEDNAIDLEFYRYAEALVAHRRAEVDAR